MWFCFVFSLAVVLAMTPFWLGILPPPNARCLIRLRNNGVFVSGEALPHHATSSIADILRDAGVKRGFIALTPNKRIKFSHQIPKAIQQRLRNVMLNP